MIKVETEQTIDRSADDVWAYAAVFSSRCWPVRSGEGEAAEIRRLKENLEAAQTMAASIP